MAHARALVIAVETYTDEHIPPVPFGSRDGAGVAAALAAVGYEVCETLLDGAATKTAIESALRGLLRTTPPEATLCLAFVGHAARGEGGTLLLGADARAHDLEHTAVPLASLLAASEGAARLLLLLDVSHPGPAGEAPTAFAAGYEADELQAHFGEAGAGAALLSCGPRQFSYRDGTAREGIWCSQLQAALRGASAGAEGVLTAHDVQAHLAVAVPASVHRLRTDRAAQEPVSWGGDLTVAQRTVADATASAGLGLMHENITGVSLWSETSVRADQFAAFDKKYGHRVPDAVTPRATAFLQRLAADDIAEELKAVYGKLRTHFRYRRKDLELTQDPDAAAIATPDFDFVITIGQRASGPGAACVRRDVINLRSPEVLSRPGFDAVFGASFDGLDLQLDTRLDVEALIDHLEEAEPAGWTLDYEPAATFVELRHAAGGLAITIHERVIRLTPPKPLQGAALVSAVDAALGALDAGAALAAAASPSG